MQPEPGSEFDRCVQGDGRAWAELVDRYAGLVYAVARRQGLREDQCDDAAQRVFSALFKRIHAVEKPDSLGSWLAVTAKREAWRILRLERRELAGSEAVADEPSRDDGATVDAELLRLERVHEIRQAIGQLGSRCRELIEALFMTPGTPDYAQISRRTSIPIGSIGPTRQRCLARLAELLGKDLVG